MFDSLVAEATTLREERAILARCAFMPLFTRIVLKEEWDDKSLKDDIDVMCKIHSIHELVCFLLYLDNKGRRGLWQGMYYE